MDENLYAYWLSALSGLWVSSAHRLLEYAGSFKGVWELSEKELKNPGLKIRPATIRALLSSKDEVRIIREYRQMEEKGIRFYHLKHELYPSRLRFIYDAPIGIYLKGSLPDPTVVSVAIVGARGCSDYGRTSTRQLGMRLAEAGFQVISGLARGIDGIAQKAAVDAGGYSCAVLGCGPDICYPEDNRDTYEKLAARGGIISEYPPMTPPRNIHFPQRNRIISGLSDIVVVIEAREKSGSLITADMALEQGRDIYTLPGRICDPLSYGCNRLIKQGAGIIISAEEFIRDLALAHNLRTIADSPDPCMEPVAPQGHQMTLAAAYSLSGEEKSVLSVIGLDPKSVNAIQDETGLDTGSLMKSLMNLSVRGLILQKQGHYVLAD